MLRHDDVFDLVFEDSSLIVAMYLVDLLDGVDALIPVVESVRGDHRILLVYQLILRPVYRRECLMDGVLTVHDRFVHTRRGTRNDLRTVLLSSTLNFIPS
jgi:hypothetical protein